MWLKTYNLGRKTSAIGKMDDHVVEVVQVRFVLRLKLMKEVEEAVRECSMRLDESGRKPSKL